MSFWCYLIHSADWAFTTGPHDRFLRLYLACDRAGHCARPRGAAHATASAGRNTRWTRMYSIGTGNREFWMHLWRMFSKKEFEGKGWLMRQKEELIWARGRATASAGRNTRWTRMYSIGTGNREFWMHLRRMFSKKRNSRERGG